MKAGKRFVVAGVITLGIVIALALAPYAFVWVVLFYGWAFK